VNTILASKDLSKKIMLYMALSKSNGMDLLDHINNIEAKHHEETSKYIPNSKIYVNFR
jgi:hypothetical protein